MYESKFSVNEKLATREGGVALYDNVGNPITGDLSADLRIIDAGTEIDQAPGVGVDQAPRQAGPDTGALDPDPTIRDVGIDAAQICGSDDRHSVP